jgi:23S rRNA-/tRNA-specific pseudouridylate synthase
VLQIFEGAASIAHPDFNLSLKVVFEDQYLAVVEKPAGFPVNGNRHRTIEHALPSALKNPWSPTPWPDPACSPS